MLEPTGGWEKEGWGEYKLYSASQKSTNFICFWLQKGYIGYNKVGGLCVYIFIKCNNLMEIIVFGSLSQLKKKEDRRGNHRTLKREIDRGNIILVNRRDSWSRKEKRIGYIHIDELRYLLNNKDNGTK